GELIGLYHQRREEELAIGEAKTRQLRRPVLRSQTPEGVEQEVAALLLAHHAVRRVMAEAACRAEGPPRRIRCVGALEGLRCRRGEARAGRARLSRGYRAVVAEAAQEVLPARVPRSNPRVKKCPPGKWPAKRKQKATPPQPDKPLAEAIALM